MPESAGPHLLDHLFRRQAGRLVSSLAGLLGAQHLQLAEDAVQEAMLRAVRLWPFAGVPERPEAWLFQVSHHYAISALRRSRVFDNKTSELIRAVEARRIEADDLDLEPVLRDEELRMLFICCHPELAPEARIALSLNLACGFSVREIARIFLTAEPAMAQRLVRAKRVIRERNLQLQMPDCQALEEIAARLDSVLDVIYLMFSGGYSAQDGETLIRSEICLEALRLGRLLTVSSMSAPRVDALVALMAFQSARLAARTDASGDLALFDDQDRSLWDEELIALGFHYFDRSIQGDAVSSWHIQAAIASAYAQAAASANGSSSINWLAMLEQYDALFELTGSPVVALNRAVVVFKAHGAEAALLAIAPLEDHPAMRGYHLLPAVRGRIFLELNRGIEAQDAFAAALACPCAASERRFLLQQLELASQKT